MVHMGQIIEVDFNELTINFREMYFDGTNKNQ